MWTQTNQRRSEERAELNHGQTRRMRKTFNELCDAFANKQITNKQLREKIKTYGVEDEDLTNKTAMVIALFSNALKGDVKAFEVYRDTIGEKPKDTIDLNGNVPVVIKDDIKK